jgi:TRAP-type C4-dicarboxylate transport system permease small subunit
MRILKTIAGGYNKVLNSLCHIAGGLIIFLLLIVCLQVFARILPIPPVLWTTDFAMYCMIALGFLGIGWLLRKGAHVAIDILVDLLPFRLKNFIGAAVAIIGAFSSGWIVYYGISVSVNQFQRGVFTLGSLFNMPKWILLIFIPIGFFFAVVEFTVMLVGYIRADLKIKNVERK